MDKDPLYTIFPYEFNPLIYGILKFLESLGIALIERIVNKLV